MDDALTVARSQTEESQAARMIFSTTGLFRQFIKYDHYKHTHTCTHTFWTFPLQGLCQADKQCADISIILVISLYPAGIILGCTFDFTCVCVLSQGSGLPAGEE